VLRAYCWGMGDKSPGSHNNKKQGKSLKEKREVKTAKKAERGKRGKLI
jgi:hypothetical protein